MKRKDKVQKGKDNHHFIPQAYLRAFAVGEKRKARVFTVDQITGESFTTLVRNVGSRRHFNRVEIEGVDPDFVENATAYMEDQIAPHLVEVIGAGRFPTSIHRNSVMNLISNIAVRNPRFRHNSAEFHRKIARQLLSVGTSSEPRWRNHIEKMKANGFPVRDDISYQAYREFLDSGEYELVIDRTHLVRLELDLANGLLKSVSRRNWCFATAASNTQFITSDDPAVLIWMDGKSRGFFQPGHEVLGTHLYFPLSPSLMLIGAFEKIPSQLNFDRRDTTLANTLIARYAHRQIFAKDGSFFVDLQNQSDVVGHDLARHIKDSRRPK